MSVAGTVRPQPWLAALLAAIVVAATVPGTLHVVRAVRPVQGPTGILGETTKILAADSSDVAALHGEVNRTPIPLGEIPEHTRNALIAIEDRRFWEHGGIDPRGTVRAASVTFNSDRTQGGSTITQQLAKNIFFPNQPRTMWRKAVEAVLALGIELLSSKQQILEAYLNNVYFGRGAYGIQAAAGSYFGKDARDLTLAESAHLAGLVHMPGRYDWSPAQPLDVQADRKEAAAGRRNLVLGAMADVGAVTPDEAAAAAAAALDILPPPQRDWPHAYFVDAVLRELGVLRSSGDRVLSDRFDFLGSTPAERAETVYGGGLRIETTLDVEAQRNAEAAVAEELPPGRFAQLSAAFVAIDPGTGAIRALVGGRDYYPEGCEDVPPDDLPALCRHARVNLALGHSAGGSGRQAGSAFKPFVLAAALEDGVSLRQTVNSSEFQKVIGKKDARTDDVWKVQNYEGSGGGTIDIIDATARSVNAAYARLEVDVLGDGDALAGSRKVAAVARKLGIGFPTEEDLKEHCGDSFLRTPACTPADRTPSIALGAKEISPLDLAAAYATFANNGVYNRPTTIARITDSDGNELYRAEPQSHRAISVETALGITHVLQEAVERGTGRRAQLDRPVAGKTGTSQGWRDAWFAGYVPQLAAVTWIGNPTPVRTRSGAWVVQSMTPSNGYGTRIVGGSYPARIWRGSMSPTLEGLPEEPFPAAPQSLFERPIKRIEPEVEEGTGVPGVVGSSRGSATSALRSAGFRAAVSFACPPGGNSRGIRVWSQNPPPGTPLPPGATVTVFVSRAVCR